MGVGYTIEFWSQDQKLMEQYEDFDRDYDPSELFPTEEWIAELFEPIRKAWFVRPTSGEDVPFFMTEQEISPSATVAQLVGSHPKRGKTWWEAFVFKHHRIVQVYLVKSFGRRFYRSLYVGALLMACQPASH